MSNHQHDAPAYDEHASLDPHGEHHHGHVILSQNTLRLVLGALLVFTVLTVGASRAEVWAANTFDLEIPQWVNVLVAMSIAVVKGSLVALFFMQLKYDNKLNAIIMLSSLFAVALFLGITMIDLGVRGSIYPWKVAQIAPGGTGVMVSRKEGGKVVDIAGKSMVTFARDKYIQEHGERAWEKKNQEAHAAHGAHHDGAHGSSADRSRPRRGLTAGLHDEHAPADDHGDSAHGAPSHAQPEAPAGSGGH